MNLPIGPVVVGRRSSNPKLAGVVPIPVDHDHGSIARPNAESEIVYTATEEFLRHVLRPHREVEERRAGALCYRLAPQLEFLLVRTSGRRWSIPKGHIERNKSIAQTAVEEALEEGGVQGIASGEELTIYLHPRLDMRTDPLSATKQAIHVHLVYVPFEVSEPGQYEPHRDPTWMTPAEAKRKYREGRERFDPIFLTEFSKLIDVAVERIGAGHVSTTV